MFKNDTCATISRKCLKVFLMISIGYKKLDILEECKTLCVFQLLQLLTTLQLCDFSPRYLIELLLEKLAFSFSFLQNIVTFTIVLLELTNLPEHHSVFICTIYSVS